MEPFEIESAGYTTLVDCDSGDDHYGNETQHESNHAITIATKSIATRSVHISVVIVIAIVVIAAIIIFYATIRMRDAHESMRVSTTFAPTLLPTIEPTSEPTSEPTLEPTMEPTTEPTLAPTFEPTLFPTLVPSIAPSASPTFSIHKEYNASIATRMCQFALITYCVDHGQQDIEPWTCPPCLQYFPGLQNVTGIYTNFLDYDINAFVVYDDKYYFHSSPVIVVAFAGTDPLSMTNWVNNLKFIQSKYPLKGVHGQQCDDCYVHKGFWSTYNTIREQVWQQILRYRNIFGGDIPIQITGHSLGGALASFCALDGVLTYDIAPEFVYTFGAPRCGDEQFATFYESLVPVTYRVTHRQDPVPHLPTQTLGTTHSFWHIKTEVFYPAEPDGEYHICDSGENSDCADQYNVINALLFHVNDHLNYMAFDFTSNYMQCKH